MYANLFSRRGLSLDRLRVLLDVAEAGGIAKAVGDDPVRQSQYSRQLKELEDFFGVELTRRAGKSLALTAAGERLAVLVRESYRGLSDFAAECQDEPVVLSIGAGDSLLHWLVLPRIGTLQEGLPNVRFDLRNLRTAEVIKGLADLRLDFGLVRADAVPAQLKSKPLGTLEYALFVPISALRDRKKPDCRWALSHLPIACLDEKSEFGRRLLETTAKAGFHLNIRLGCESFPQACHAVASGGYAAVLPRLAAADLPPERFAVLDSPLFRNQRREIALVWNPRMLRLRAVAQRVLDGMTQRLQVWVCVTADERRRRGPAMA